MNVETFKSTFRDMARPNRFKVVIARAGGNLEFFCKATQVPNNSIPSVDVEYQGRIIKIPGDRENPDWALTVYGDTSWDVYTSMTEWMKQMNDPILNVGSIPVALKEDGKIQALDRQDNPVYAWKIVGCFPTDVGSIPFDWSTSNTPLEWDLTLANDYITPA